MFICRVIMEQCVLGIEAEFWQDETEAAGPADVPPLTRLLPSLLFWRG